MSGAFDFAQLSQPEDLALTVADRRREADEVLAAARAEADAIRARAHAEGLALGRQEAAAALEPAGAALAEAVRRLGEMAEALAGESERAAVELALRVADQVVGATIEAEPERVLDAVRGALRRLLERERIVLLVNPDDLELVRDAAPGLVDGLGGVGHWDVQAERRVPRGGAIVRTDEGEVDATLATKLERAREVVVRELAG